MWQRAGGELRAGGYFDSCSIWTLFSVCRAEAIAIDFDLPCLSFSSFINLICGCTHAAFPASELSSEDTERIFSCLRFQPRRWRRRRARAAPKKWRQMFGSWHASEGGGDAKLSRRIGGPQNYYGRSGERVRRDEIAFASQIHSPLPK